MPLGPMTPRPCAFTWGLQAELPRPLGLPMGLIRLAVFAAIGWIHRRGAARLQRRIEALDAMAAPSDEA